MKLHSLSRRNGPVQLPHKKQHRRLNPVALLFYAFYSLNMNTFGWQVLSPRVTRRISPSF